VLEAIEEEAGSETSAKDLIRIVQLIREKELPAIFTETNGSSASAEIISRETGVTILSLDMAMAGDDYFTAMYANINAVKEAFK
jgi:zinc transport system substrate-binding protein